MVAITADIDQAQLLASVVALQAKHAELIDDDRLEEWPELFVEDCLYKVLSRENADRGLEIASMFCTSRAMLLDRIVSLREANIYPVHHYRHIIGMPTITVREDGDIEARSNYLVLQTRNDGNTTVYNAGKYVDRIRREAGEYKFVSKVAIFDTNRIDTMMVKPI